MEEYVVRYRDPSGRELVSLPKPTVAKTIHHARVLELRRGTILTIVGPEGEVSWVEMIELAESQPM